MINITAEGNIGNANTCTLPFAISNMYKYAFKLVNLNGAGVYVQIKLTWAEILI